MTFIRVDPIAVSEGTATATFVIRLDAASSNEVKVNYTQQNGTAVNGGDFNFAFGTLTFAPGETSKQLQLPVVNDTTAERTEVFWLDLTSAVNAVIAQRYTPALIFDNDATAGTPAVSVGDVVVDESARTATFFVSLNRPSTGLVSMSYSTADSTAVAGQDYRQLVGTLNFSPGEMVKSVTVELLEDTVTEADERLQLNLSNAQGASFADALGLATIGANDSAATSAPAVLSWPVAASEGDTFASFVVQLSAPSLSEVSVNYTQQNETALNGSDFNFYFGTLVFAPGETTKILPISLLDNTVAEATENFWLDLSSPVNASVPQRYIPALIFDNDATVGTPDVSVGDLVVDEASRSASFFVSLNRPAATTVTVDYSSADDTSAAGQDFRSSAGTLSFAPGEVVKTVTVDLFDDSTAEVDEGFKLLLSNAVGASLADSQAQALIARNDAPPTGTPFISSRPVAVSEGDTFASFVVQLSAPSVNPVKVNYTQQNETALNGSDFNYYFGTLAFAPGETVKTLSVALHNNTTAEGTELFWLDLSAPVNATVAQRYTPALIFDNDGTTGTPGVSVSDVVVDESAQTASFFVWLNRPAVSTVRVDYASVDDTAQAGQDFTALAGSLSFAAGEMVQSVTVKIIDDNLAEPDERFSLQLSNPVGATLVDAVAGGLIGRSDTAPVSRPQVLTTPVLASEGDLAASLVVQLSAPSQNTVSVDFTQQNGTALNGSDYNYYFGTLVFAPGETLKLLPITLLNDTAVESAESFAFDLTNPVNATVPQRSTNVTIHDNDGSAAIYSHGLGNDLYSVSGVLDRIIESPRGGIDTVRASVSYVLPDHTENLVLTGSALNAVGNAGNNILRGNAANNQFDGQAGIDTVIFSGARAGYTLAGNTVSRTVSSVAEGSDSLLSIDRLQFADTILANDTTPGGNTYLAYAMFNAGFNRGPAPTELSHWTSALDRLGSGVDLAQAMITFYAPGVSNQDLVAYLWGTIVGGNIPLDQLALYVGLVDGGTYTQASLLELVATLDLNTIELAGVVGQTLSLDPAYFPAPGG